MSARPERPFTKEMIELIADQLHVLGEPTRIQLMQLLKGGEATVQHLTDELPTTHQNVSKHLRVLLKNRVVGRRGDGNRAYYVLNDLASWWVIQRVGEGVIARAEELHCSTPSPRIHRRANRGARGWWCRRHAA